jgi:signal transduction histidine kinase
VEDIVALPQIKDGTLKPCIQKKDVRKVVQGVVDIQELQVKDKDIGLTLEFMGFRGNQEFMQPVDALRFQQVLLNYYSNAIKHVEKERSRILILT